MLVYGIIHGFCKTENQYFIGSLNYLMSWTEEIEKTVTLNSLVERGLLVKEEAIDLSGGKMG